MAGTSRTAFVGAWLSTSEHAALVRAAREANVSQAALIRMAVLHEVAQRAGLVTVTLGRDQAAAAVGALEQVEASA
jgi:hypothetical protein